MKNDSTGKVLFVAVTLCVVCSVLVSAAAVGLRGRQEKNARQFKQYNVLIAAGLAEPGQKVDIDKLFEQIQVELVDLATGKVVATGAEAAAYDAVAEAKKPASCVTIPPKLDSAGIKHRAKRAVVYKHVVDGKLVSYVLPIYGKGLWSTMYGFLAVAADRTTIKGIVYYEQGETPGLGGEVENPRWRAQFPGKKLFDASGNYDFRVLKGVGHAKTEHEADGLSGATMTTRGVDGMIRYWLGPHGLGPYFGHGT